MPMLFWYSLCTNLHFLSIGSDLESMRPPEPWQPAALVQAISNQTTVKVAEYHFLRKFSITMDLCQKRLIVLSSRTKDVENSGRVLL
jgi:hypothetical protein